MLFVSVRVKYAYLPHEPDAAWFLGLVLELVNFRSCAMLSLSTHP